MSVVDDIKLYRETLEAVITDSREAQATVNGILADYHDSIANLEAAIEVTEEAGQCVANNLDRAERLHALAEEFLQKAGTEE